MSIADVLSGKSRWVVIHADCLGEMGAMVERGERVDHVITDPPYLGARGESWEGAAVPLAVPYEPASEVLLYGLVESAVALLTRWLLVFNDYEGEAFLRRSLSNFPRVRTCYQPIVWVKPPGAFAPSGSAYSPPKQVEFITAARTRSITGRPVPGSYISPPYSPGVEILRTGGKPLSLMLSLVADFTDPDELILDPFCGSGTTGVACLRLGRRFIGIEKDTKYAAIATERLQAEERGLSLREARAGQTSIFDRLNEG